MRFLERGFHIVFATHFLEKKSSMNLDDPFSIIL